MFDILNVPELGNLEIVEIYDYHNMPILFSCRNSAAQLYMVFFADYFPDTKCGFMQKYHLRALNVYGQEKLIFMILFVNRKWNVCLKQCFHTILLQSLLIRNIFTQINWITMYFYLLVNVLILKIFVFLILRKYNIK